MKKSRRRDDIRQERCSRGEREDRGRETDCLVALTQIAVPRYHRPSHRGTAARQFDYESSGEIKSKVDLLVVGRVRE